MELIKKPFRIAKAMNGWIRYRGRPRWKGEKRKRRRKRGSGASFGTQKAYNRLEEIYSYIQKDSAPNARKWSEKLLNKVGQLPASPKIGRKLPEIASGSSRKVLFGNYRIIYRIKGESIYILTIRHFKQILPLGEME